MRRPIINLKYKNLELLKKNRISASKSYTNKKIGLQMVLNTLKIESLGNINFVKKKLDSNIGKSLIKKKESDKTVYNIVENINFLKNKDLNNTNVIISPFLHHLDAYD